MICYLCTFVTFFTEVAAQQNYMFLRNIFANRSLMSAADPLGADGMGAIPVGLCFDIGQ